MIKRMILKNFKSLKDIDVSFHANAKAVKNLIVLYGENGVGKSNLVAAIYSLYETTQTLSADRIVKDIIENWSDSETENNKELAMKLIANNRFGTKEIINRCKMIGSKENMCLDFEFLIDEKSAKYTIEFDGDQIVHERLDYVFEKNVVKFFDLYHNDKEKNYINKKFFLDLNYETEFLDLVDKYWSKHSIFAILVNELSDKQSGYLAQRISGSVLIVIRYIYSLSIHAKDGERGDLHFVGSKNKVLENIVEGKISFDKKELLEKTEKMLNLFFTQVFSDVQNVYYLCDQDDDMIEYKLFLQKQMYNNIVDIPFALESTGTKQIVTILPSLLAACEGHIVVIDEFDEGIHDVLIMQLLDSVRHHIKGQLIVTTHSTLLLESDISSKSLYVFNVDSQGNKELFPLSGFGNATHKNMNRRKQYLKGMYGGVPYIDAIDFDDLVEELE